MPLEAFAGLIMFAAICAVSRRAVARSRALITVGAVALAARALFCAVWQIAPADDFLIYYQASERLSAMPLSEWAGADLGIYITGSFGYMAPFVKYQAFVLKYLPGGVIALRALNATASAATAALVCAVAGRLYGARAGLMAGLAMALNPFVLFFMSALTNQHIATFFMMAAVALITLSPFKNIWLNAALAGILLALSNVMRPEAIVVVIALFCARAVRLIKKRGKIADALPDIALAAVYLLITGLSNTGDMNLGYKLLVGLNQDSVGAWNPEDAAVLANAPETIPALIRERLISIPDAVMLMLVKTCRVFLWYSNPFANIETSSGIMSAYPSFVSGYNWGAIIAALIACARKERAPTFAGAFICFMLLGFVAAYAVIETQSRYAYVALPLIAVLASRVFTIRPRRDGV